METLYSNTTVSTDKSPIFVQCCVYISAQYYEIHRLGIVIACALFVVDENKSPGFFARKFCLVEARKLCSCGKDC